jgi:uncharacterized protein YceK
MRSVVKPIALIFIFVTLTGCGTTGNLLCDKDIYGGVTADYLFVEVGVHRIKKNNGGYGMIFLGLIDMPFSFIFDTVSLVYTVPAQLYDFKKGDCNVM